MEGLKINERIGILRAKKNMSGKEFAEALGTKRSTVNNWETGGYNVKADDIEKICTTFDVSADWLLGISEENNYSNDEIVKIVSKYTGLSTKAVNQLHKMNPMYRRALMPVFEDNALETIGGFLNFAFRSVSKADPETWTIWAVTDIPETKFNDDGTIDMKLSPKEAAKDFVREAKEGIGSIIETVITKEWNKKRGQRNGKCSSEDR